MTRASIATVCISGSLDEKIEAIARARFDGIELFEPDLVGSGMSPEEVRQRLADRGLTLDLYQPMRDIEGTSPHDFDRALERARRKFALMERLGADTVLVCSNVATAVDPDRALAVEQLAALADVAADHGVRVAYEALAWGRFVSTYDDAWQIVRDADHPSLGVCLDSFHILSRGTSLDTIAEIPGEKIFYLQLADAPDLSLDVLSWSRHHRLFPGEGDWDLPDFTARVLAAGYLGPLSLEVFNDVFRQGSPLVTAQDARRSLVLLDDQVNDLTPGRDHVRLPAAPTLSGVSFIEIQPGEGSGVAEMLDGLGFTRHGSHRRKDVQLWEQGAVRIVVNNSLLGRDAAIVSLGIAVADAEGLVARAAALLVPRVPRDELQAEARLDEFAAPDGTLVVADATQGGWHEEFGDAASGSEDAGLTAVDHVSLVMPWQRTPEALLFFRGLFGFEAMPSVDVASEVGLLASRSLTSGADDPIRLVLNVPPAGGRAGDGFVNHVAFVSRDLRATVRVLRGHGVELLDIPANYYDDVQARLGLDDALVAELRELHIFIDRDGDDEFLHAYLRPLGALQIEIVERTPGYRGFGAPNAPVRLAALRAEPRGGSS